MKSRHFLCTLLSLGLAAPVLGQPIAPGPIVPEIREALMATKEMRDLRACARANAPAYALMKAAEAVIKSAKDIRVPAEVLAKQFNEYKALGGPAASPAQVRPPQEPCRAQKEAAQVKAFALSAAYRQCAASHEKEIKLASAARQVMRSLAYIELMKRLPEKRPESLADEPVPTPAELAQQFSEYRAAGGPATRIEDVREIPDPCVPGK